MQPQPAPQLFFGLSGNETLAKHLCEFANGEMAEFTQRHFPDEETYLRVITPVAGMHCILVCSLHHPDDKIIPLYYLATLCKELGAKKVTLIAPYLSYMRQDTRFNPGEAVTSEYFAKLLSHWIDELITIDPHLHRTHSMSELYTIPCHVLHATEVIAKWIKENIQNPVLIGPDAESEQWVSKVAFIANAPFTILTKVRLGDNNVEVSISDVSRYQGHTPVLVDDIISTAHTMMETIRHINKAGMQAPTCIGVHGIFAGNAFEALKESGAGAIITCNTIPHATNRIDVSHLLESALHEHH